jgi:hypothetical protein
VLSVQTDAMQRFGNGAPLLPPNRYASSTSGSSAVPRSSGSVSAAVGSGSGSGVGQMRQFQLQHERQPALLQVLVAILHSIL